MLQPAKYSISCQLPLTDTKQKGDDWVKHAQPFLGICGWRRLAKQYPIVPVPALHGQEKLD